MIAYEELAAALERWRIRNGLPGTPPLFADGPRKAPAVVYSAPPVQAYAPPPVQAYAPPPVQAPAPPPPRPAPPIAPPPSAETIDEDLDVLDEDHLDNDGPDFVVGFNAPAPAAAPPRQPAMPGMSDDDAQEASQIGGTDPGIVPPPADDAWPEAASFQSSDATASAQYGWGNQAGSGPGPAPKPLAAIVDDDDDDGGTLVNG